MKKHILITCITYIAIQVLQLPVHAQKSAMQRCSACLGITGDSSNATSIKTRAGFVLAGGGGDADSAMQWFLERSGGGDIVIIRASGSTGYNDYLFKLGKVNSVESLLINSRELAYNDTVLRIIKEAEGLFIAGGDQWNYVQYWKDTPLNDAINYLINQKKVPIGGTSAGLAVLGEYCFDARFGSITSDTALQVPAHPKLSITNRFFNIKWLRNTLTDSHYDQRNRQGRHLVMLANISQKQNNTIRGIGIDEQTALCIDNKGNTTVFGKNKIWVIDVSPSKLSPQQLTAPFCQMPFVLNAKSLQATAGGTPAGKIKSGKWPLGGQKVNYTCINGSFVVGGN
ncbi:MAG: cyanophycinase [Chitinophagaceae bacterium]|nr:cyanophycinase [Chitinophagaceae bacterium]